MHWKHIPKNLLRLSGFVLLLGMTFGLMSCGPTRYVRPLEQGEMAVSATLGGPFIGFAGAVIPIPFTTVGAGYGITEKITAHANLHPTAMLFGTMQADLGVTYGFFKPKGWIPASVYLRS